MITTADLARRDDFRLGSATISPSSRTASGPGGTSDVEPRVMQVLIALAEEKGAVVSRETLFERCWGDVTVGDDSLNRAVAGVRKIGSDIGAGSFAVETIPRTGYRMTADVQDERVTIASSADGEEGRGLSRRAVAGTLAGLAVVAAGGSLWWRNRDLDHRFAALMDEGQKALDDADGSDRAVDAFSRAVLLRPDSAEAQGKLAYALTVNSNRVYAGSGLSTMDRAAEAMRASLAINPRDLYARLAGIEVDQANLDMADTDERLSALLAEAPNNTDVLRGLWSLRQSAGLSRNALALVQRAIDVKPLAAGTNYPFGQMLWITGQVAEADRILERAIGYWPSHPYVRFARFNLLTYTGRTGQAETMIDNPATRPQIFGPPSVALWQIALKALADPTPANIEATIKASMDGVNRYPQLTSQAVLSLAQLGEVDPAFAIASQLLQGRATSQTTQSGRGSSVAWRFAPWLFTPPAKILQRDPRFNALCDATGLTAYWAKRVVRPDYRIS